MQTKLLSDAVAGEVRAWLARRGRSARSAALELGWTEVYLSRRLTGQVTFNVDDLYALAGLLEIPVNRFFNFPDEVNEAMGYARGVNPGLGSGNLRSRTPLKAAA